MLCLLFVGLTGSADAPVGNAAGRHGASALPFASCQVRPLDQLKYLAKVMGFEIQVTNIPKVCLHPIHLPLPLHAAAVTKFSLVIFLDIDNIFFCFGISDEHKDRTRSICCSLSHTLPKLVNCSYNPAVLSGLLGKASPKLSVFVSSGTLKHYLGQTAL